MTIRCPTDLLPKFWADISYTVWKFHDFSINQILREINFGESRSAETAIFVIFGALNSVDLVNSSLQKVQKSRTLKFRASKCVKMADFALQESLKLISRKIWVTENLWNFHTVLWLDRSNTKLHSTNLKRYFLTAAGPIEYWNNKYLGLTIKMQ